VSQAPPPAAQVEHFATLFDSGYLAQGLALYESLAQHAGPFHLWVLCMDAEVERRLAALDLPHLTAVPLAEVETEALLAVKPGRTAGEYCWTLTPFLPAAVLERAPAASRVTYLDADLFFFDSPRALLHELDASGSDVLITEHAYAPEYDQTEISGRFCVQFLTFRRTPAAREVWEWWQERCLEWCFARPEPGRFGDQKYLDDWPERFEGVHVVEQRHRTLAPWNAEHFTTPGAPALDPVFFHFHGFQLVAPRLARLFTRYRVGPAAMRLYGAYLEAVGRAQLMAGGGHSGSRAWWRRVPNLLADAALRGARFRRVPGPGARPVSARR
jgi:hypothetical protein